MPPITQILEDVADRVRRSHRRARSRRAGRAARVPRLRPAHARRHLRFPASSIRNPAGDDAGVRTLYAHLPAPALEQCHTIEIVVALGFLENHTPYAIGGDSVTWFYAPTGSLADCPLFDAGPVPILDAGPGDGGSE